MPVEIERVPEALPVEIARTTKPRYFFVSNWPVHEGTGVNNVIFGLSRAMASDGFDPRIVVTGWRRPPDSRQIWLKLPALTPPLRNLAAFAVYFFPNLIRLRRLTRGAVAVNPHYFGPEVLPLLVLRRFGLAPPVILSAHGADVTAAAQSHPFSKTVYAWICGAADAVVACSASLAAEVKKLSPGANVIPIWNGVSQPPKSYGPRPLAEPYLVSVAAFVRKKGHDVLLRAFQLVRERFPSLKLVLIGGDGPERTRVQALVGELGLDERVEIRLKVPHAEIWGWLRHAEVFVHAAREEPFGIAILEAGLAGTPVVTTAVGGIDEYFDNGVHGLMTPADAPEDFAEALLETLRDPLPARQRAAAFERKARSFTWQAAWEQYRTILGV